MQLVLYPGQCTATPLPRRKKNKLEGRATVTKPMFIGGAEIFTAVIENALDKMTSIRVFKHSPGFKALFSHSLTTKTAHLKNVFNYARICQKFHRNVSSSPFQKCCCLDWCVQWNLDHNASLCTECYYFTLTYFFHIRKGD